MAMRPNPKLADTILQQAEDEEADEEMRPTRAMHDESDYEPPWLEIDRLKAEYDLSGEDVRFQVFREGPGGYRDIAFIKTVPPDEFDYEMLQGPPYNGGKFRVYIRNGKGLKRNFGIVVEPNATATRSESRADNGIAPMIAAMSAGFTTLSQQIARTQQSQPTTPPLGVRDVIELMASLRGIATPAPSAPQQDPFDMLAKVFTMQKQMQEMIPPAGNDGDMSGYLMGKALDTLTTLATGDKKKPPTLETVDNAAPVPQLAAPVEPTLKTNSAPFSPEIEQMNELAIKIAIYKTPLLLAAKTGSDPYPYACIVVDNFTSEQIAKYIGADDWFAQLLTLLPDAAPYQEWFATLRVEVKNILQESPESDSVDDNSSADAIR